MAEKGIDVSELGFRLIALASDKRSLKYKFRTISETFHVDIGSQVVRIAITKRNIAVSYITYRRKHHENLTVFIPPTKDGVKKTLDLLDQIREEEVKRNDK